MLEAPNCLSPSRVEAFTTCPMAFRFASIEHLPEQPNVHTTKGSLVHRALELLFVNPPARRTRADAEAALHRAIDEFAAELAALHAGDEFCADAWSLIESYLAMEDPTRVRAIGVELRLAAQAGDLELRGIIDRLDLDDDGELIVTDYKTGRPPWPNRELRSLGAVHFYAFLCEQVLGRLPKAIRLVYLRDGLTITAHPSPQSVRFVTTKAHAVWRAIEQACATDGFEPHPSSLCSGCGFQRWCPAFGGDPSRAAAELLVPA